LIIKAALDICAVLSFFLGCLLEAGYARQWWEDEDPVVLQAVSSIAGFL